jgi:hypothetical protein
MLKRILKWVGLAKVVQDVGGALAWTGAPRLVSMRARESRGETIATMVPRAREIGLAYFATSLSALASERDAMPKTLAQAGARHDLGSRPVLVLTHGQPMSGMAPEAAAVFDATWLSMQKDMASWSSRGAQRTIADAGHYIPNDDPAAVIGAIREVVDAVRRPAG